jgi:Zinc finger, C2H2 type/C2H2-type zinc finger
MINVLFQSSNQKGFTFRGTININRTRSKFHISYTVHERPFIFHNNQEPMMDDYDMRSQFSLPSIQALLEPQEKYAFAAEYGALDSLEAEGGTDILTMAEKQFRSEYEFGLGQAPSQSAITPPASESSYSPGANIQTDPTSTLKGVYSCPFCHKTYTRKYNMQSHMRCHTGIYPLNIDSRQFPCTLCPASFVRKHDLSRHVRSIHTETKPHVCPNCSMSFARSDGLKRHMDTESKLLDRPS